ncbi:Fasciclin-like arabinogalactan protein [Quillaja saponaria]|uniref:Fasciclin-like arabinogalactan protein n=1 Tax=Quillaja saponaria TaxID=32244 RepID=A0AAD7PDZ1_QUISA|nr:Fasciclin-like arabinogalactan protein [Quillaja saponaria]
MHNLMSSSSLSNLFLLLFSFIATTTTAFNITKILDQYSDYSTFNNFLTQTHLAGQINSRQTITVLTVDNSGMSPISGKPMDTIKMALSLHVILDYYDVQKLQHLDNKTVTLTTLFQASGQASGQQGFLKVTDMTTGGVSFVPASDQSSGVGANLVKSVVSQPYNISCGATPAGAPKSDAPAGAPPGRAPAPGADTPAGAAADAPGGGDHSSGVKAIFGVKSHAVTIFIFLFYVVLIS